MSSLQQVQKTIDACRFCWMCRHVCPIGLQTTKEINGPRGRGLVLSSVLHGKKIDEEVAEAVYECSLCGACVNQCVTGYDPTVFTRAARSEAVVEGLVPPAVEKVIGNLFTSHNPYGLPVVERNKGYSDLTAELPAKAEVLLFIGCSAAYKTPGMARAAINLFEKANISFTVLKEERCCGLYLSDLLGPVEEAKNYALKTLEQINETEAKVLVPVCPSCSKVFKREYQEWGLKLEMEVITLTQYLADLISKGKLRPKMSDNSDNKVTFHDPCRLARDLEESEPVRFILKSIGMELKEMFFNKKETHCCGGGLLHQYAPHLTTKISPARWREAERTGVNTMVVACPSCKEILSESKPDSLSLESIVEMVDVLCNNE